MPVDAQPIPHEGFAAFGLVESIIPVGATTFTLTFGPYTDALGTNLALTGKLYPVDQTTGRRIKVVHLSSGQVILPADIPIIVDAGSASVGPLPHTGQASMTPFFYHVEWNLASSKPSPGNKTFAVPSTSGTTVDYDLLAVSENVPGVEVTRNPTGGAGGALSGTYPNPGLNETAVDALIAGLLNDPTSATYAAVVALINARTGFGRGA